MSFAKKSFTNEQLKILKSCAAKAVLAADIAHAHVSIYVPDSDPKNIYVYAQAQPLTRFVEHQPGLAGRSLRRVEEPLIVRSMQRGIVVKGKREWVLGSFAYMKSFPLFDRRRECFGAVVFEMNAEQDGNTDEVFVGTAMQFLRQTEQDLLTNDGNYRRLLPTDGLLVVNHDLVVTAANNTAKHIFLILGVADLIGRRTNSIQINWPLVGMVIKTGMAESKELAVQGMLLSLRVLPIESKPDGDGAIVVLADVTELHKKDVELQVKTAVIKEIHHRVKNNLQTIASLLRLQSRRAYSEETKLILRDCINRVNSIAVVHDYLSCHGDGRINVGAVAREIYQEVLGSMVLPDLQLHAEITADDAQLPSEEVNSIALTLNELLQNAIEHAFTGRTEGTVKVSFKEEKDGYELKVTDDGVGLPEGFSVESSGSLGLKIVQTMIEADLGGCLELRPLEKGTCVRAFVPHRSEGKANG